MYIDVNLYLIEAHANAILTISKQGDHDGMVVYWDGVSVWT